MRIFKKWRIYHLHFSLNFEGFRSVEVVQVFTWKSSFYPWSIMMFSSVLYHISGNRVTWGPVNAHESCCSKPKKCPVFLGKLPGSVLILVCIKVTELGWFCLWSASRGSNRATTEARQCLCVRIGWQDRSVMFRWPSVWQLNRPSLIK